jgi:hypothetical protein
MAKKRQWHLDPKEVGCGSSFKDTFEVVLEPDDAHRKKSGPAPSNNRTARAQSMTKEAWVMTHFPTGIEAHGMFWGFYSRAEKSTRVKELFARLFAVLEQKVAKDLRVAGR